MRGDSYDWEFHRQTPMPPPVMGLLPGAYPGHGGGWGWNWWGDQRGYDGSLRGRAHRYDQSYRRQESAGRYGDDFMGNHRSRYADEYFGRAALGGRQWLPNSRYDYGYRMYGGPRSRYGRDFGGW